MSFFSTLTSPAIPFFQDGISTEMIYAGPRADLAGAMADRNFFCSIRFDASGQTIPENLFDRPSLDAAAILIAGEDFGCGNTPEVAARALAQYGFACVIAASFADGFAAQLAEEGVAPLVLSHEAVAFLASDAGAGAAMTIDMDAKAVITQYGDRISFDVAAALAAEQTAPVLRSVDLSTAAPARAFMGPQKPATSSTPRDYFLIAKSA
ncbi:MAG: hypothetical protein AAGA09_00250 [Pseudomonadota bacterium]